jgi:predicted protein tyrosine phosphatase
MKFLCVCDGGNVRSVALAYVLHDRLGHEAIAVGRQRVSPQTLRTFCAWADRVVVLQPHMEESIPEEFRPKVWCVDVGPDRFGLSIHPELLALAERGAKWLDEGARRPA